MTQLSPVVRCPAPLRWMFRGWLALTTPGATPTVHVLGMQLVGANANAQGQGIPRLSPHSAPDTFPL